MLNLERYEVDGEPRPAYTASLQSKPRDVRVSWNKMQSSSKPRTLSQLDLDVGASLARQWAQQQADTRRNCEGVLERAADVTMNWEGRLAPGAHGVRLLVITLFCWGATLSQDVNSERVEWDAMAQDFADVLNVLSAQAGPYKERVSSPNTTQENSGKRVK